jgi:2'-5' RNA ligase
LDPEAMSVRRLMRVADRLRMSSGAPSASWTTPEKLHLTLKFADRLSAAAVSAIGGELARWVIGVSAPTAVVSRVGAFPSLSDARVVVIDLADADGALARLAAQADALLAKHGVPAEARPFRAHVTVARLKRPYDARRWLKPEAVASLGECRMAALTLYRSELGAGGSVYTPLSRAPFEGEGAAPGA